MFLSHLQTRQSYDFRFYCPHEFVISFVSEQ